MFTQCPCLSAAVLNLVNQKAKLRSEWKVTEKQPSNDRHWTAQDDASVAMMQLSNTRSGHWYIALQKD